MKHVFDYEAAPKEWIDLDCAACGGTIVSGWTTRDRYGFVVAARRCSECGHVALAERMTPAAYADFYASGAYRRLVSAFHGREINGYTLIPEQAEYARKVYLTLKRWLPPRGNGGLPTAMEGGPDLLDVGGSTGIAASLFRNLYGYRCTVLDPSPEELKQAENVGHRCIVGNAESFDPGPQQWELILLCQAIDHLLDPAAVLTKLRKHLAGGGVLWVDALDYEITRELKIDHPHNFTEKALERLLDRTGWVTLARARWNRHVGFVCTA